MHLDRVSVRTTQFPDQSIYPFNLPILRSVDTISFPTPVTFFVGENGSGKSTILEAIARASGIHIWRGFPRARYRKNPHERELWRYVQAHWSNGSVPGGYFASELFKSFSELLDEWATNDPGVLEYFGDRSLMTLSHGQGHMAFFESRFGRKGLYLLDEPETALSPMTQRALLELLERVAALGEAQFIIATHSPILLSVDGATIYDFDSETLDRISWSETSHYRAYVEFFRSRKDLP